MLFDLKKVFDLVKNKLLINKLSQYEIYGLLLQYLISYLSEKYKVNGLLSIQQEGLSDVPQGSCLFLVYCSFYLLTVYFT